MALKRLKFILLLALVYHVKSDSSCDTEIENTLRTLLSPQANPTIQLQALRRDIFRKVQEALEQEEDDEKRSLSSLARTNNIPFKRNLEALARAGYINSRPKDEGDYKRSIAYLAKNGQLPIFGLAYENDDVKRGIESLARNGELRQRREIQELLDELDSKRVLADLKRNIASIARENSKVAGGKRNLATLYENENGPDGTAEKRNLASIKAQLSPKFKRSTTNIIDHQHPQQQRNKREADDYYDVDVDEEYQPVYQNQNMYDYEDLLKALSAEKRFLGSVAKSGWFRPSVTRYQTPDKRHIGALARLGWLPTLRNIRRFNRSERSTLNDSCRETTTNGQTENEPNTIQNSNAIDDKRFLVQPAVDKILLKKMLMHHPRTHQFLSKLS